MVWLALLEHSSERKLNKVVWTSIVDPYTKKIYHLQMLDITEHHALDGAQWR